MKLKKGEVIQQRNRAINYELRITNYALKKLCRLNLKSNPIKPTQ